MPSPEQLVALTGVIVALGQILAVTLQWLRPSPQTARHADSDATSTDPSPGTSRNV